MAGHLCENNGSAESDEAGWDSSELVFGLIDGSGEDRSRGRAKGPG